MHLTLKREATKPPAKNFLKQQAKNIRRSTIALDAAVSRTTRAGYHFHDRTVTVTSCARTCLGGRNPEGAIVGVPKRGGLIYAPVSDAQAVASLERGIRSLYKSSANMRVSSGLYRYKDGTWTVHRKLGSLH